jgi:hypothetical protein
MREQAPAIAVCVLAALLCGCANGDFGRVRPSLVSDGIHDWVGRQAAWQSGFAPSTAELTDDERQLRDLAYTVIAPPYDRGQWDSVLFEYGILPTRGPSWPDFDPTAYGRQLLSRSFRSPVARYSQLIDDIRNDSVQLTPFIAVARRVLDMDQKRKQALAHVSRLTKREHGNALRRIAENALVIAWAHRSLHERAAAYQYALERIVLDTPSPEAVEAERALAYLRQRTADARLG